MGNKRKALQPADAARREAKKREIKKNKANRKLVGGLAIAGR